MARVARQSNTAMLFPEGVDSAEDATYEMMVAIQHAFTILGWYENLTKEEMPAIWMWPFPDELDEWFTEVELLREQKYGRGSGDDGPEWMNNEWEED